MPSGTTPNLGLTLPSIFGDNSIWGQELNSNFSTIDTVFGPAVVSGANSQVVFSNNGALGVSPNLVWDNSPKTVEGPGQSLILGDLAQITKGANSPSFRNFTDGFPDTDLECSVRINRGDLFVVTCGDTVGGINTGGPSIVGLGFCGGTLEAPSHITTGTFFAEIDFYGYNDTTGWVYAFSMIGVSDADWTGASLPCHWTLMNGSAQELISVTQAGAVTLRTSLRSPVLTLTAAAPTVAANQVGLGATTATTVGASGGASPPPANPVGYLIVNIAGTNRKIPYYNV